MARHGLSEEQIAWRRTRWQVLRGLAGQEYAEDAVSCFLASGECVFDMEAIEQAAAHAGQPVESQENGRAVGVDAAESSGDSGSTSLEWIRRAEGRRGIMRARR